MRPGEVIASQFYRFHLYAVAYAAGFPLELPARASSCCRLNALKVYRQAFSLRVKLGSHGDFADSLAIATLKGRCKNCFTFDKHHSESFLDGNNL